MAIIQGTANWACLSIPNTKFDPCYSINLHVNDEEKAKFEETATALVPKGTKGCKVPTFKKQEDGSWMVRFKQSFYDRDGSERPPIVVVGADKSPLDVNVGNGSTVRVMVNLKYKENGFGKFVLCYLNKVQVLNLVEYNPEDFDEVDTGTDTSTDDSADDEEF